MPAKKPVAAAKTDLEEKLSKTTGVKTKTPLVRTPIATDPDARPDESTPESEALRHVVIDRMFKDGSVVKKSEAAEELIEVRVYPPEVPVAEVEYGCKMTLNLGNFESVSITVGVTLPSSVEELDEAFDAAKNFVDRRLNKEVASIRSYRDSKSGA
jgi:hypothetical protein